MPLSGTFFIDGVMTSAKQYNVSSLSELVALHQAELDASAASVAAINAAVAVGTTALNS